jgi:DNA ligase-1
METTFGRPEYRFPPAADVMACIVRFCRETIDQDQTAILYGYSLGRSQELLRGLDGTKLPILLHEAAYQITRIYEEFGWRFPAYERLEDHNCRGKVLICPSNAKLPMLNGVGHRIRSAVVTGWAMDSSCRYRYQTDEAFPLSDHADFPELIELVNRVRPKQIFTVHGFGVEFAQTLRELGFDARAPGCEEQLSLPLSIATV